MQPAVNLPPREETLRRGQTKFKFPRAGVPNPIRGGEWPRKRYVFQSYSQTQRQTLLTPAIEEWRNSVSGALARDSRHSALCAVRDDDLHHHSGLFYLLCARNGQSLVCRAISVGSAGRRNNDETSMCHTCRCYYFAGSKQTLSNRCGYPSTSSNSSHVLAHQTLSRSHEQVDSKVAGQTDRLTVSQSATAANSLRYTQALSLSLTETHGLTRTQTHTHHRRTVTGLSVSGLTSPSPKGVERVGSSIRWMI